MSNPKTPRKGKVHSFGDALDAKVERASKALGFEPTSDSSSDATPAVKLEAGEQLLWIDVDAVDDNPFQPRTDYPNDAQLDLIRTINEDGQLMPIGVRPHPSGRKGRYQARFGHRRKHAVGTGAIITDETGEERRVYANAGVRQPNPGSYIGKIWGVVRETDDAEMRREAWQENAARLALPIMDQARFFVGTREALSQGREKAASWAKVAEFLGESDRVYVYRVASLLDLPGAMRAAMEARPNGEKPLLNERHGRALLLLQTADGAESHQKAQRELFREIKKELLSGAEAERRAKERRQFLAQKTPSQEDQRLFKMQADEQQAAAKTEPSERPTLRSVEMPGAPVAAAPVAAAPVAAAPVAAAPVAAAPVAAESASPQGALESAPNDPNAPLQRTLDLAEKGLAWIAQQIRESENFSSELYEAWTAQLKRIERNSRTARGNLEEQVNPSPPPPEW